MPYLGISRGCNSLVCCLLRSCVVFPFRVSGCAIIGMPRRPARLAAQRSERTTQTQDEREVADLESLWCSSRQPQGDRFIIECDHKGDKCYHWYHDNCVGVTPAEGRHLESQGEPFICPFCTTVLSLPSFNSATAPEFTWGSSVNGSDFCDQIQKAYKSIVHWKHNLFLVLFDSVGSQFVTELANLYDGYGSASALESIALKATMVLPPLLLQKPLSQSKSREYIKCLEHRLLLWCEGDINALLNEGLMIQQHLEHSAISPSLTTLVSLLIWFFMAKLRPLCGFL